MRCVDVGDKAAFSDKPTLGSARRRMDGAVADGDRLWWCVAVVSLLSSDDDMFVVCPKLPTDRLAFHATGDSGSAVLLRGTTLSGDS